MGVTQETLIIGLLTYHFIGLSNNSPPDKNVEEEFEVNLDLGPGDGVDEETVMFGPKPREDRSRTWSKFNKLTFKRKREQGRAKKSVNSSEADEYNYDELMNEYYGEVYEIEKDGATYNYTENNKTEETVADSLHTITDFKSPVNCTVEEQRNIGFQALHCLWHDLWHADTPGVKSKLLKRAMVVIGIWIAIYLLIVIPLWCTKGWCCCCCRCKLCYPRRVVLNAKKYMYKNRPGEITLADGETEYYEPTKYEREAYRRLQRSIKNF
ncbi:uncharacterized protein LOC124167694 [Ischnura elegans]|uniref:uncharacterized protein LOC124167694 n=1 Tax=Ischnura elegans TaxID=197161 RepID=UPI001ED8B7B2|nr:uncharacterized protein LOC124167694 [Ischnura elegans]